MLLSNNNNNNNNSNNNCDYIDSAIDWRRARYWRDESLSLALL